MNSPNSREDFGQLLSERGLTGPAVEVGVAGGHYSEIILSWGVEKLWLVDLWKFVKTAEINTFKDEAHHEATMNACLERLSPYLHKIAVLRGVSWEMASHIPDNSCDFVYIDCAHDEASVEKDLAAYWPKLRSGGIMAGHDFVHYFGVRSPVIRLAEKHGRVLHLAIIEENDISWWFEKP